MPMIETTNLYKTYKSRKDVVEALRGVNLTVNEGEVFGLLGPNGAGKSTTVKILTTLSRPDRGEARIAGFDVLRQARDVRWMIGVVGQRSGVDRESTGRENLTLQGRIYRLSREDLARRVQELLDRFGLADAADRLVRTYSGGMQRRLDVAMGLIHRPRVLFLDEPTTGLDPEVRAAMWEEIAGLTRDEGLTILLTTHYLEEADRLANRLAIMDRGKIVTEGTPEVLKRELRGDTIQIELAGSSPNGRAAQTIERLDGVREIALDGRTLRARADHGATAVPAALAALEDIGIPVVSVTVARPSLDDVYLRYTGRAFDQAHREAGEVSQHHAQEAR
jgi:ABC-2 type transport system ATP-binding protein